MRKLVAIVCALLLTACAYTPSQVIEQGRRFDYTSAQKPLAAAKCISRTADDSDSSLASQLRDGLNAGSYEVIVRLINDASTTAGLFQIEPASKGSRITGYISPNILSSRERFAEALVGDCAV